MHHDSFLTKIVNQIERKVTFFAKNHRIAELECLRVRILNLGSEKPLTYFTWQMLLPYKFLK
jgi:hypothetical protein